MTMREELKELERRRRKALEMGGPAKIQRQHQQGKFTARERIELLCDVGSFQKYGLLATHQSHRPEMEDKLTVTVFSKSSPNLHP